MCRPPTTTDTTGASPWRPSAPPCPVPPSLPPAARWRHVSNVPNWHVGNVPPLKERSTFMATGTAPERQAPTRERKLVEMSWDPITRIVGSLGIYTKIDFANKQIAECYSTSSVFRGYSIFMKGKDPRDAHFITSRICGICGDN